MRLRLPLLAALMLGLTAADLASESVTMTTYYPAPSGVYSQMITTGNTYLARDGGSVDIGTVSPDGKLHVRGDVIIEGNLLMTGQLGGYRPSSAAGAAPVARIAKGALAAPARAPAPADGAVHGLCQERMGVPTPDRMTCGGKTIAIAPAACDARKRCACGEGYELVALGISMPTITKVDPKNRTAPGLQALLDERIPVPIVTYGCVTR